MMNPRGQMSGRSSPLGAAEPLSGPNLRGLSDSPVSTPAGSSPVSPTIPAEPICRENEGKSVPQESERAFSCSVWRDSVEDSSEQDARDALTLPSEGAERRGERRGQLRYYVRATMREPWGHKWNRFWSSRWFWSCGRLGPVPGLYYADYWKRP